MLALLFAALGAAGTVHAQSYPTKPVTVIVPFAAGGAADVLARLLTQNMKLGQPLIIDNKGGAGGTLGAGTVAKAPADGHTLLFVTAGHAGTGALYPKLTYDPVKAFSPVIGLAKAPIVLAVNAQSKYKTLNDFIADARANPAKLNCAGGGGGATVTNLAFEAIKKELKLEIGSIPYRGSAPAATALLGGEIDCDSDTLSAVLPHIKGGKLRALAVTSKQRSGALPDVPTVAEAVLPKFDASVWFGVLAPAGTPQPVIARLNSEFQNALRTPQVQERLKELGFDAWGGNPAEFSTFLASETQRWGGLITSLGLKPE